MKLVSKIFIIVGLGLALLSCSSDNSSSTQFAPSTLAGGIYEMTVVSGAGILATTGSYTITFAAIGNMYEVTGDGINVGDSAGTYTFSSSGNQAVASFADSTLANGAFSFIFNSASSGDFIVTIASDASSTQSGTFTQ